MSTAKTTKSAGIAIVSLRWNGGPLAMRALRSGEEASVGAARDALAPLPRAALGAESLVVADVQGGPHVCVPAERVAKITNAGGGVRLVAGPVREALAAGEEASLVLGDFEVLVAAHEDEVVTKRRKVVAGAWVHTAVVASVHAALLFAGSRAALAGSLDAPPGPDLDALRGYLAAAEERTSTPDAVTSGSSGSGKADERVSTGHHGNGTNGGGERHAGESGKAGSATSRGANKRWGVAGSSRPGDAAAADAIETVREFGMIGLLRAANEAGVRPIAGVSPWATDDAFTAMGGMFGRTLGEAQGSEGLALTGIGEGGGGTGEGIGLGRIGTIGHLDGLPGSGTGGVGTAASGGSGIGWGGSWGRSIGLIGRGHRVKGPVCHCGGWTSVEGRLPPETVQRIVRQNFGRFRACYENGLRSDPALAGRVSIRFVIGRDGSVMSAADGGSDLPNEAVRSCVQRSFYGISFPQPEGGIVTVTYPLVFSSAE